MECKQPVHGYVLTVGCGAGAPDSLLVVRFCLSLLVTGWTAGLLVCRTTPLLIRHGISGRAMTDSLPASCYSAWAYLLDFRVPVSGRAGLCSREHPGCPVLCRVGNWIRYGGQLPVSGEGAASA